MTKPRFWASRGRDNYLHVLRIAQWSGPKPRSKKGLFLPCNNPHTKYLESMKVWRFKQLNGWTVPQGRCVETTDPRVKQIRSKK